MKKEIAVVGCGHWGKNLIRVLSDLGVLLSICDNNIETAQKYAGQYNVKIYSFDEIISDMNIKGVVLAVPVNLHASMAIEVMNAGKHVFVEKPIALNLVDAELMISCAIKNNVQLMVGHLMQYHPIFKFIRKFVEEGKIGKLNYVCSNRLSFGKIRSHEDVIWSFAPHDISMILSLTGQLPKKLVAKATCISQKNIADTATIHMEFNSGLKSLVSVSWFHPYKEQKLVLVGNSKMLVFDDAKQWSEKLALYPYEIKYLDNKINLNQSNVTFLQVPEEEPLKNECLHFVDVVTNETKPITDGYEGLKVLKVLSAATISKDQNKEIKLSND
jgi:predicted dehydrogenase